ncbi:MAG: sugar transferase [Lachnospiraceae bacterium]|nr:sugar transferase [Lachnospiraceae bacterium]
MSTQKTCYTQIKRIFDIFFSFIGLAILSPVFIIIGLAVYLDDPHGSPVFFQSRIGKDGKPFTMYKFRTMVKGAEEMKPDMQKLNEMDGPVFKIKKDPRMTHLGSYLRRTGLDELPQLFNILRGDMSFVGPRPPLPEEVTCYSEYQKQRLSVLPGLTCTWQIMPNRNDISFYDWVEMDLDYIAHRSVLLDLKVICKTPMAMIHKGGR